MEHFLGNAVILAIFFAVLYWWDTIAGCFLYIMVAFVYIGLWLLGAYMTYEAGKWVASVI